MYIAGYAIQRGEELFSCGKVNLISVKSICASEFLHIPISELSRVKC